MIIHALHGIVDSWKEDDESHRLYADRTVWVRHLTRMPGRYGSLYEADSTLALTIDDATVAGKHACLLARRYGHNVTFFVNPLQIIRGEPYWFNLLDTAIDRRTRRSAIFDGRSFDLADAAQRKRFRLSHRTLLLPMGHDEAVIRVAEIAAHMGASAEFPEAHTRVVTVDDLRELREAGVDVQSHGWDHVDTTSHSADLIRPHIQNANYFLLEHGNPPRAYAAPYGRATLAREVAQGAGLRTFLLDQSLAPDWRDGSTWNRVDVTPFLRES